MLNKALADEARMQLQQAARALEESLERAAMLSVQLHELRQRSSHELIPAIEEFVNGLAAHPKSFDKRFAEFRLQREAFDGVVAAVDRQLADATITTGSAAGAGAAMGAATVFGAPTVAMSVATTFGTASTGTAISTLSGAAATKAALAWLGGGALAAGGSGAAGGQALLLLAGPVGVGLAALSLAGGALFYRHRNGVIAEEAGIKVAQLDTRRAETEHVCVEILALLELTRVQVHGVTSLLAAVKDGAPSNYRLFDKQRKEMLGALVNHVHVLGSLLNKKVETLQDRVASASEPAGTES